MPLNPRTSVTRKRPHSRAFTPKKSKHPGNSHRYLLDRIPIGLWIRVRAKVNRDHVSLRHTLLAFLTRWVKR